MLAKEIIMRRDRIAVRTIRVSDAQRLESLLRQNRSWLKNWEATTPGFYAAEPGSFSLKSSIRSLRKGLKEGSQLPLVMLYDDQVVGQLTVANITYGAVGSANLGYWVAQEYAGLGITPTSVALTIDHLILERGLHRMEICLRPENDASRRVVEKLGLRFEGLRERFLHIDGGWRDHHCFAITAEEIGPGLISRL